MKNILVTAKLIISDHDGYCSGNECEISVKTNEYTLKIPDNISNDDFENIEKYLPVQKINDSGSFYCKNASNFKLHDIEKHDYRYEIISVKEINIF